MTKNTDRQDVSIKDNKDANALVLYRLGVVEGKVDNLNSKLDGQNFPTRSEFKEDLKEFQDLIVTRFTDLKTDLQKQIDGKANAAEVADIKRNFYALIGFLSSIILALVIGYLTTKGS